MSGLLNKLFAACKVAGYRKITVQHKLFFSNQITVAPYKKDKTGWPAIWGICKKLKIDLGCGWSDGHQIKDNLPVGKWKFVRGRWKALKESKQ